MKLFNTALKIVQKEFATRQMNVNKAQYLYKHSAEQLVDRMLDIKKPFPQILDYLSGFGAISAALQPDYDVDLVLKHEPIKGYHVKQMESKVHSEFIEGLVPSRCILSNLRLHWENDILNTFKTINSHLEPDGCFIGSLLGGDTLYELRSSIQLAEQERLGGFNPHHFSPMTTMRDVGALMSDSKFVLPTVDYEEITINYPSIFELLSDLELMGERNALLQDIKPLRKDVLVAAASIYHSVYGSTKEIPATFQIIYFIGWKKGNEQLPKKPTTGSKRITDIL